MQLTAAILALASVAGTIAAPAPVPGTAKSMMANVAEWTIEKMTRTCNSGNTSCVWSFHIDTHTASPTPCTFTVTGNPASQSPENGAQCGPFTVTSGWSGQFGPGNGFTTLSVIDYSSKLIVWPAYTDVQLSHGALVTPDQSYAPVTLG